MTEKVVNVPVSDSEGTEAKPEEGPTASAEQIQDLQRQVEEYRDRWLRAQAEVENVRKWGERRTEERVTAERERLLRSFAAVADNLERALGDEATVASLRDGVALTHHELLRLLSLERVTPMQNVVGQPFDPFYHEAVSTVSSSGMEEGKIVRETQTGYLVRGRSLRLARVFA